MDPDNMCHEFKRLLVKAGLPDIRFHDLRHTAASLMLQQGVHPKVVQERLGHPEYQPDTEHLFSRFASLAR